MSPTPLSANDVGLRRGSVSAKEGQRVGRRFIICNYNAARIILNRNENVFGALGSEIKKSIIRWVMSTAPPKGKTLFSKLWIKFSSRRKLAETGDLLRLSAGATLREEANYQRDLLDDTTFLHDRQAPTEASFAMCAAACIIPIAFIG
jgi:hypothetical protein